MDNSSQYYLIFDLETTGLPKRNYGSMPHYKDIIKYDSARIVQLCYSIYTNNGLEINKKNYIINCKSDNELLDFNIPKESTEIHGIDNIKSISKGDNLSYVINEMYNNLKNIKVLVAHNIQFDLSILKSELWRLHISENENEEYKQKYKHFISLLNSKNTYCTMKNTVQLCKIPFNNNIKKYKYPKLEELYNKLFNKNPKHCHDASYDVKYTAKCFFKLKKLNTS